MATSPDPLDPTAQPLPFAPPAPSYRSETHKGVEIRTRCTENPRNYLWTGSYSFFTRTIANRGNDRICRELPDKFNTEEAAVSACFKAGRFAIDVELLTQLPFPTNAASPRASAPSAPSIPVSTIPDTQSVRMAGQSSGKK
ncbi:MAG: hypothetical protein V4671_02520 [Armatimonadota bacterium]